MYNTVTGCQPSDITADSSVTCGVYRDVEVCDCNHSAGKFFLVKPNLLFTTKQGKSLRYCQSVH